MKTNNAQILKARRDGFSDAEIASMFNLDPDVVKLAVSSELDEKVSLHELRENFLPEAFDILKEIARDGERDADRLKACQIIIQGEGVMPVIEANKWSARLEKLRALDNIIEISSSRVADEDHQLAELAS